MVWQFAFVWLLWLFAWMWISPIDVSHCVSWAYFIFSWACSLLYFNYIHVISHYCTISTKCSVTGHKWLWIEHFRSGHGPPWTLACVDFCEVLAHFGLFCLQMNSFGACHGQNLAREHRLVVFTSVTHHTLWTVGQNGTVCLRVTNRSRDQERVKRCLNSLADLYSCYPHWWLLLPGLALGNLWSIRCLCSSSNMEFLPPTSTTQWSYDQYTLLT